MKLNFSNDQATKIINAEIDRLSQVPGGFENLVGRPLSDVRERDDHDGMELQTYLNLTDDERESLISDYVGSLSDPYDALVGLLGDDSFLVDEPFD